MGLELELGDSDSVCFIIVSLFKETVKVTVILLSCSVNFVHVCD